MSAQTAGPDFEGVVRRHTPFSASHGVVHCGCTYGPERVDLPDMSWPGHAAHVAAALRAEVRAWLESEGASDVTAEAIHRSDCGCPDWHADDQEDQTYNEHARATLAALAECVGQVASVGEGEG